MAITLITGPANAGKARAVLDGVRADAARGREPLLIVPTHVDVESYRRELAAGGLVRGVRVERFGGLLAEVVRRAGVASRPLTPLLRERVLAAVAARVCENTELAARPGFVRALAQLVGELEVERVTPQRLRAALAAWGAAQESAEGAAPAPRAAELGALFAAYHRLLDELGRSDPERPATLALDALRRSPALWGGTPVHFYGFDDLTRLQFDAIQTLGRVVEAPVTVSLAYEAGRVAFAGRAAAFQTMLPWASEHRALPARAECYALPAREALHRLERGLFEPREAGEEQGLRFEPQGAGGEPGSRVDPGRSVHLLEGGSPRAELELVAGEVRALLDEGMAPHEVAIVHRSPPTIAELLGEVLQEYEVPCELPLRVPFSHTALGHALCGLLAAALEGQPGVAHGGRLEDLLAWLRAPGVLRALCGSDAAPELADRLEADARAGGIWSASGARSLWEQSGHPRLETLDRIREAAKRGPLELIERTRSELQGLSPSEDDARALTAAMRALEELADVARGAQRLAPNPGELLAILRGLELGSERGESDAVAVLDPLALRARRVRALFLCGLQANVFPAPAHPPPWLSEEERRGLAEASGLRLALPDSSLAAERYLFYAAISRPEEVLALSWHCAGENGDSAAPSLFIDDVCDLFPEGLCAEGLRPEGLRERRVRRSAGDAEWPGPGRPPASWEARELACASPPSDPPVLQSLQDPQLLAELREGRLWSASSLKNYMSCPARWLVESLLRARDIDPDAEPLARGGLAHAALRDTLEGLRRENGSARLSPASLPRARELLQEALARQAPRFPLSVAPERVPGVRRRLEADLERYLEHACAQDSPLEPSHLELGFGFAEGEEPEPDLAGVPGQPPAGSPSELPPLDLGQGVRVRGRIDRIDLTASGQAVVYDYKGAHAPPPDRWLAEGHIQAALYMRAAEQLLDHEAIGGFYQPLAGRDLRARGVLASDSGVAIGCVRGDTRPAEDVEELVNATLDLAREAAQQADAGCLKASPGTCAFGDGHCLYPSICRSER
jgi:ATP-dependent helicase/DNAse subunit B